MGEFGHDSFQISITGADLDTSNAENNVYRYRFPGSRYFKHTKLAVSKVSMYYSWFNITSAYNNNSYQLIFTDGGGSTTYDVDMPDGYYTVSNLNTFLQSIMIANGLYLVDASGNFVYYAEILADATYYSVQLNVYPFPTSLPAGYTNPNALTFPATASAPQFIIEDNAFQQIIGFTAATIPAAISAVTVSTLSDFTPQVTPVQSLVLRCSLINNRLSNPTDALYPFSNNGVDFGGLIESVPSQYLYLTVNDGHYEEIVLRLVDQAYNNVQINDTNIVIQLSFIIQNDRSAVGIHGHDGHRVA
jgi:hypothetical protein